MHSIVKKLSKLTDDELMFVSEAIDTELGCRMDRADEVPESARRRAVMRGQSYRHSTGAAAPPVRAIGLKEQRQRRFAA